MARRHGRSGTRCDQAAADAVYRNPWIESEGVCKGTRQSNHSLSTDARILDHFGPFLDLATDVCGELSGRAADGL
jgi:hypothetical protein